jgi:hypothetical protein
MTYIKSELKKLYKDEIGNPKFVKLKLASDNGETKWLSVDLKTLEKISKVMLRTQKKQGE